MDMRVKYLTSQLGKKIEEPGAHIPHAAVTIIRKLRKKNKDIDKLETGGGKTKPVDQYNPYPFEFLPGSM